MSLLDNLVSHWKLNEASGTRSDSHGSNHLADNNTVTQAAGKLSDAADFTAANSEYLSVADNVSLSMGDVDFTIACWVWFDVVTGNRPLATKDDITSGNREYGLILTGSKFRFHVGTGVGAGISAVTATTLGNASTGQWYFVVCRHNATANTVTIQVNNGTVDSAGTTGAIPDSTSPFHVGGNFNTDYHDGRIDSLSIWKGRLLTSDEVTALYNAGAGVDYEGFSAIGASDSIAIDSPTQYFTNQRDANDQADIAISGTYTGSPTAIEASFNGGAYQTIDAAPSEGAFSGSLTGQAAGQGTLAVRFTNDTDVSASVSDVGIGDVFVVAGQSNAEGRATNAQSYSHATIKATVFRQDDAWAEGDDPTDTGTANGSPWPLLATMIMAETGFPVAFITASAGATGLVDPADWSDGGAEYEDLIQTAQNSGVTGARAILWHQGETDANNGVSAAAYAAALSQMLDDVQADLGFSSLKLIPANLGYKTTGGVTRANLDAIRQGQLLASESDADILHGPILYDIGPLADGVHFQSDVELQELADRWWRSIGFHFFSGVDGRSHRFGSAFFSGDEVTITLAGGAGSLENGDDETGWRVIDGEGVRTVSSAVQILSRVVLTCDEPLVPPVSVGFGGFNDAAGATLADSGETPMPPEPFVLQSASPAASYPPLPGMLIPL